MLQRSGGISVMASVPAHIIFQNASGESEPPGKRQPIPTMARGSFVISGFIIMLLMICRAWFGCRSLLTLLSLILLVVSVSILGLSETVTSPVCTSLAK